MAEFGDVTRITYRELLTRVIPERMIQGNTLKKCSYFKERLTKLVKDPLPDHGQPHQARPH